MRVPLYELPADGTLAGKWWKLQSVAGRTDEGGEVLLDISYKVGRSVGAECGAALGGRDGQEHAGIRDAAIQARFSVKAIFYAS